MSTPLLATKLYIPPVPYQAVARGDLIERLDEGVGLGRRLTLVTAPPGYGKTSLIAEWVNHHSKTDGTAFCWYSLEESDNDPALFWTYLLAALRTCQPGLGEALTLSIWAQPNPAVVRTFLTGLVNETAGLEGRLVLTLDDFHFIQNEAILSGLAFLIEHLPVQFHLVLLSRSMPPLPLSRWRARGQVTELGQDDLRFTPTEAETFLHRRIAGVSAEEVQIIQQRLEGWPAGLQLTALTIGSHPYEAGSPAEDRAPGRLRERRERVLAQLSQAQPYLVDYLADEVLSHLPEPVQALLLRTSLLEQLCPELCAAVMDGAPYPAQDYQAVLTQLEKQSLFLIPLDPERKWFRYQHLIAQLLRARLSAQTSTQAIQELHRKAAAWYHEQGFGVEAIGHAVQGDDLDSALAWAEQLAPDLLLNGRINALLSLIKEFPTNSFTVRPRLGLYQAQALMHTGQYDLAWERIQTLEPQIDAEGDSSLKVTLANLKALVSTFTRPPEEASRFAREALAILPEEDRASRARMHLILGAMNRLEAHLPEAADEILKAQRLANQAGQAYMETTALENLAALRMQAGDFPGAHKILSKTTPTGVGSGFGQVCLASIELEWGRLEAAEGYLNEGLRRGEKGGVIDVLINGYVCLSHLRWAQRDYKDAVEALNMASELATSSSGSLWNPLVAIERRWLRLKLNEMPDLADLNDQPEQAADQAAPRPKYIRLNDDLVTTRELLLEGKNSEAISLIQSIENECEKAGLVGMLVSAIVLKAIAYQATEDRDRALGEISRAIRLAAPDRLVNVFVNEGEPARRLLELHAALSTPGEAVAARQILSHFHGKDAGEVVLGRSESKSGSERAHSELVEPLTSREQEVLGCLAAGYTNREIADRLVMTENTVKKHTSHIFGKLAVSNRTQALVKAREVGLIP